MLSQNLWSDPERDPERDMLRIWQEIAGGFQRPCLLCAEKTAEQCHRRLLGEALVGDGADRLKHLYPD